MNVVLFFTRSVSLAEWIDKGLFDREKLLYHDHLEKGRFSKIYWITYGENDKHLSEQLKKQGLLDSSVIILQKPSFFIGRFGTFLFSFLSPFIYSRVIKNAAVLKTNQMNGAWSAIIASKLYNKKLYLRTGYTQSKFIKDKNGFCLKYFFYRLLEFIAYKNCDIASVSSLHDKNYIIKKNKINEEKIKVLENYIDTSLFYDKKHKRSNNFVFVGRLNSQKNLFSLIDAVKKADVTLDIYGAGSQLEALTLYAKTIDARVTFKGKVSNSVLPDILNSYKYYILPSLYEGMPKTLLEAMACGCICLGTNVKGINEILQNLKNGFLIKNVSSQAISDTIKFVIKFNCGDQIVEDAIKLIENYYSLSVIVKKEYSIIREVL